MMNEYARFAELAWQTLAPTRYKALEDPNQFFSTMGEEAAQRVLNLTLDLEGGDIDGETYLEKVGRLTSAKMQAQEIVRQELLPDTEMDEEPAEGMDDEQTGRFQAIREFNAAVAEILHSDE